MYKETEARAELIRQTELLIWDEATMVLAFFATREEIGLFAVASMLTFQATVIPDVISTVLMPKVAGDGVGKKELVAQCFRLTAIICGILLLVIAVFAEPIVVVLFSPKFIPAVLLIRILSIGLFQLQCFPQSQSTESNKIKSQQS